MTLTRITGAQSAITTPMLFFAANIQGLNNQKKRLQILYQYNCVFYMFLLQIIVMLTTFGKKFMPLITWYMNFHDSIGWIH